MDFCFKNTGQADLEEEMAALQEFNASEDEVHEYVYPEESQSEEDPVEEFDETEESLEESAANENEVNILQTSLGCLISRPSENKFMSDLNETR